MNLNTDLLVWGISVKIRLDEERVSQDQRPGSL